MTIVHRRLIYSVFFLVFFTISPILIMYASGYRYNFKKNDWQKTGFIFLESKPKSAQIFLNGKLLKDGSSPWQIKNLLPNEYQLKLSKTGYHDWQKNIEVYDGQTAFVQYVRLFKKNPIPTMLIKGNITQAVINGNQDKIAVIKTESNKNIVSIYNFNSQNEEILFQYDYEIKSIEFKYNDSKLIIYTHNKIFIIDLYNSNKITGVKNKSGLKNIKNIKLDPNNDNYFYYMDTLNHLFSYSFINSESSLIISSPIIDYYSLGASIYYLDNDSLNKTILKKISLSSGNTDRLASLSRSYDYQIISANKNYLTIQDGQSKKIFIINQNQVIPTGQSSYYSWNDNGEFIYGNNFEIWSYNTKQNKYTLFTRSGENITQAIWYPATGTHIIYTAGGKLKITENLPSSRITTELIQLDKIKNLITNKKGDKIYFTAVAGSQEGLYEMKIQ